MHGSLLLAPYQHSCGYQQDIRVLHKLVIVSIVHKAVYINQSSSYQNQTRHIVGQVADPPTLRSWEVQINASTSDDFVYFVQMLIIQLTILVDFTTFYSRFSTILGGQGDVTSLHGISLTVSLSEIGGRVVFGPWKSPRYPAEVPDKFWVVPKVSD